MSPASTESWLKWKIAWGNLNDAKRAYYDAQASSTEFTKYLPKLVENRSEQPMSSQCPLMNLDDSLRAAGLLAGESRCASVVPSSGCNASDMPCALENGGHSSDAVVAVPLANAADGSRMLSDAVVALPGEAALSGAHRQIHQIVVPASSPARQGNTSFPLVSHVAMASADSKGLVAFLNRDVVLPPAVGRGSPEFIRCMDPSIFALAFYADARARMQKNNYPTKLIEYVESVRSHLGKRTVTQAAAKFVQIAESLPAHHPRPVPKRVPRPTECYGVCSLCGSVAAQAMVSNLSTHISAVIKKYANGNRPANITMADLYVAIEVPGKSTLIQDRSFFGRASDASDQHGAHKPIQTFLMHECADVDPMYRVAGDAYSGCLIKAVREDPVESFVKYPEPFCPAPGDTYPPVVTLTSEELCQLIAASRDKAWVHILQCTDYYASSGEAWHGDLQVVVSVLESSQIDPFTHLTCTREKKTDDLLALFVDTCGASIGQAVDDEEFEFDLETDLEKSYRKQACWTSCKQLQMIWANISWQSAVDKKVGSSPSRSLGTVRSTSPEVGRIPNKPGPTKPTTNKSRPKKTHYPKKRYQQTPLPKHTRYQNNPLPTNPGTNKTLTPNKKTVPNKPGTNKTRPKKTRSIRTRKSEWKFGPGARIFIRISGTSSGGGLRKTYTGIENLGIPAATYLG